MDVLNAQQQLYSTQKDLTQAKYNALLLLLQLKAISGQLNEQELERVDQLFTSDPVA